MKNKIFLPIDTKSLYYNIFNDNSKGHTCTVATPIKQGNSINFELNEIYKIPKQIEFEKNDVLLRDLVKNSKSIVKVNNVFVFDKLSVNGKPLETGYNFCLYVKEEVDETRVQFGRIKLHYPLSLKNEELEIDNRKIINAISDIYNSYAFIVEGFEYDFDNDTLDFKVLLVGYKNIPYSKVFINNKGVGKKYNRYIKNYIDIFDTEIVALRKKYGDVVNIDNFYEYIEQAQDIGKKHIINYLEKNNFENIRDVSSDYPYSLFDLQYYKGDEIKYGIVFSTYTNKIYFNLTSFQNQFFNLFNDVNIFVVTDIDGKNKITEINNKDIDRFSAMINVVRFSDNS